MSPPEMWDVDPGVVTTIKIERSSPEAPWKVSLLSGKRVIYSEYVHPQLSGVTGVIKQFAGALRFPDDQ